MRSTGRLSRFVVMLLLLGVVTTAAGGTIAVSLYRSAFEHHREHLVELVSSQARLIAAVARFDARFSGGDVPGGAPAATLSQIRDAWRGSRMFSDSGEFVIGRRAGDGIQVLDVSGSGPPMIQIAADAGLGEPMQRALAGHTGTMIGTDHDGAEVLAAYEWIPELGLGLVAKIDVVEVQAPLRKGVLLAASFGIAVIGLGGLLSFLMGERLERDVQAERARYTAMFESSPEGLLVLTDGRIDEVNDQVCRMLQRPREEIIGKTPADFGPPTQPDGRTAAEIVPEKIEAAHRGERPVFEWLCVRPDGSTFPTEVSLTATELEGKVRLLAAVHDISERVEREETQARLLSVLQRTSDGVGMADAEGNIFYHNEAMRRLLGMHMDEDVAGLRIVDFSDAGEFDRLTEAALRDGVWQGESDIIRRDGKRVPVSQVVIAHRDARGELRYFSTIMRDISARRREEKRVRRLATAIEQISEGIVITDATGTIEYVNEAFTRITGYERGELLGRNPRILKSGHQDDAFYGDMWRTIRGGKVWRGHLVNKRKDGSFYEEEMTITPIRGPDGAIQSFVSTKRDVTEQVLLESQLQQAQKMEAVGQLAGGVAHDFNNMLTGITGYAQLLLRNIESEGDRSDLQQILNLSNRAADLTQQLLAFSRRQQLEQTGVHLNTLIASTLKMLRRLIPEDIEVEFQGAESVRPVLADSGQMVQVIMNLAVNARDAMSEGGKLVIETDDVRLDDAYAASHLGVAPGRYVMMSMSDSGVGMDRETQKHIFEPFFTTKAAGQGTGLGLATVYGIVRQHGGHVNVYSEPGVGTAFKIYLPAADTTVEATKDDSAWQQKLPEIATVLLVEDEEAVREIIERTLGDLGCHVLSAGRSSEARQLYDGTEQKIDLLVTDIVMPGGLGTELYSELQVLDPGLKVLFMSGYPDRGAAQLVDLPPGGAFLRKPFSPSTLSERVRQMLVAND